MTKEFNKDNNRFYFSKETKTWYPSVTTIIGIIAKGEGFYQWLRKEGEKSKEILTEAGDFGQNIHNQLEAIGKGIEVNLDALKPKQRRCVEAFHKWVKENVKRFISVEELFVNTEDGYGGRIDAIVEMLDGTIAILDYKTSNSIYDTHELQVGAYGVPRGISDAYILRFEKDEKKEKDLEVRKITITYELFVIFLSALKVWNWKNKKIVEEMNKDV